ncbi:MAG: CotH kinase family protein, partial [Saprospiraceae bacterium]
DVYFESENYLFNIKEPALQVGDEKYEYIQGFIQEAEAALLGSNFKDAQEGYQKYFDLEALIDWYLINEIGKNVDGDFHSSVYMNYLPGGKLKMGPIWDFDISFGNIDYHGNETTDEFYIAEGTWLSRFFEDPNFVEKVKDRYAFFYAEKENIFESIRTNASELRETQVKNYEKWPTLGIYVWPNYVYFDTYEEEVDYLIQWLEERMEWLNTAFANL